MTTPTRVHLRQVLLARARMMEMIEAKLAEMEASPPSPAELAQTVR